MRVQDVCVFLKGMFKVGGGWKLFLLRGFLIEGSFFSSKKNKS